MSAAPTSVALGVDHNDTVCRRARARVLGTVQGVGFRPYVYRLAREHRLTGFVLNDSQGVLLEAQGGAADVAEFLARLPGDAPPLAVVEHVVVEDCEPLRDGGFAILESPREGLADAPITPDTATCADCLVEMRDPEDRRYRYPLINCTNCGPRFTIVRGIPYDRPYTTMADFPMCDDCRAEYDDPGDRRFHAQPNACPRCGPSVSLLSAAGRMVAPDPASDPVRAAAAVLREGRIVAIKGIGGYHLACRADDEHAVATLRARKHREDKPFALMAASIEVASSLVRLSEAERSLLCGAVRPIVLAERLDDAEVAPSVAPGAPELGLMLPYSPLHHLLFDDLLSAEPEREPAAESMTARAGRPAARTLVMTSGNVSDEPIAYDDKDARERLAGIADLLLVHDRPIETRTDDSVVRAAALPGGPGRVFLRRSRGYVPAGLSLPVSAERQLLACGAELKNTFCVARGKRAWVSHHIGDLENYETLSSFVEGIEHFKGLFAVTPEVVAHDLHPEYLSTKYALERDHVQLVGVQHHHAHLAACLAEHGELGTAIGVIFDGTGFGTDGTVWGGELLLGDLADFRRVGTVLPVRLPGGARAISEPWRMACAWLSLARGTEGGRAHEASAGSPAVPPALTGVVEARTWQQVAELARSGLQSPLTSSVGRLFDAVAALCGLRARVNYEGQAAIELEAAIDPSEPGSYPMSLSCDGDLIILDPRETIDAVAADVENGVAVGAVASRFHAALAGATVQACVRAAASHATELIVLSGGVFANRRLLGKVAADLRAAGLRVLVPERMPVGDGGISYGQAAVAARRMTSGSWED